SSSFFSHDPSSAVANSCISASRSSTSSWKSLAVYCDPVIGRSTLRFFARFHAPSSCIWIVHVQRRRVSGISRRRRAVVQPQKVCLRSRHPRQAEASPAESSQQAPVLRRPPAKIPRPHLIIQELNVRRSSTRVHIETQRRGSVGRQPVGFHVREYQVVRISRHSHPDVIKPFHLDVLERQPTLVVDVNHLQSCSQPHDRHHRPVAAVSHHRIHRAWRIHV